MTPGQWPAPKWPLRADAEAEARIAAILARMTLEEKIGQVLQADIASVTPQEAKRYHLGSILNGGNSGPGGNDLAPAREWLALADEYWSASTDRAGGRTAVPILWGTDAVHGHSNIVGATIFPHNIGLGAARDPDLIERIGRATAIEIRVTGQEWTFAPTLTVPRDYRWGRAYEGYSSDPALVASYAGRMVRGLQGAPGAGPILAGPHVLASTKHFIADGGTAEGRDQGDSLISEAELRDIHGRPYVPAIEAGVGTIMTSFSSWHGAKIAGHRGLVTEVLKDRMNFGGFVVTDWNAHGQVAGCSNASCPQVLMAGVDMYMAPDSWRDLHGSLLAQAKSGALPIARLNDAVLRILRVKARLGLLDAPRPSKRAYAGRYELLGSVAHRALAREAVAKSLVLLKNQGGVLPLRQGANIAVIGAAADDISQQSGGWTLSWQGTGLTNADFPGATSIWAAIRDAASTSGGSARYLRDDSEISETTGAAKPDVAIVVFGETPYAEFQGDLKSLQLRPELRGHIETMRRLKARNIPVVAVMLTGRPLYVNPELNLADAFVVAWLPGSEGGGVADGLFGARPITGRLPTAWPIDARADGPALFPFGYRLQPSSTAPWQPLPEQAGVADEGGAGAFFVEGRPAPAWSLRVTDGGGDATQITTAPARALNGDVTIEAVDHDKQEGARRFTLSGTGRKVIELSTQEPIDLSRESNGDVLLVAVMRLDRRPTGTVSIAIGCGSGCEGAVAAPQLGELPLGQWQRVAIPIKCLERKGANTTRIDSPFRLATNAAMTLSLARVALGTEADVVLACPG